MNKKAGLIDRILSGHKTIESRWYKSKRNPWNSVKEGETIYFKNSGELVTAKATVRKVIQFENLNTKKIEDIVKKYGNRIDLIDWNYKEWGMGKRYCILIEIENAEKVIPFKVDKTGFGIGCAWLCYNENPMK